ncbi:unnamed protein product [Xylocopa violacea]|uniref:Secreted protein n=1 Tax=Xylocopa violacea TaxID=135666 RepID=A0ABP1PCL6_XYLVO
MQCPNMVFLLMTYEPVYFASLKTLCFVKVYELERTTGGRRPITLCRLHLMVFCKALSHSLRSEGVGVYKTNASSGATTDIAF